MAKHFPLNNFWGKKRTILIGNITDKRSRSNIWFILSEPKSLDQNPHQIAWISKTIQDEKNPYKFQTKATKYSLYNPFSLCYFLGYKKKGESLDGIKCQLRTIKGNKCQEFENIKGKAIGYWKRHKIIQEKR